MDISLRGTRLLSQLTLDIGYAAANITGDVAAARMSTNVIAAMSSGDPTFTSINMDGYDAIKRNANNLYLRILGSNGVGHGAHIELFGGTHATTPGDINFIMGNREIGATPDSVYRVKYHADDASTDVYIMDKLGNITTCGSIASVSAVQSGVIQLWSGAISAIPAGYVICDGANSTPNLTGKIIAHADADAAGTRNVGETGGADTHTLTEAELASHTHSYTDTQQNGNQSSGTTYAASRYGATTGAAGSGNAHANVQAYHALAYIMKT